MWTGVVPFWTGETDGETEIVVLPEKVIYATTAQTASYQVVVPLDLSGNFQEKPTQAELRAVAQAYVTTNAPTSVPTSIDVSFINLQGDEGLSILHSLNLCDTLTVQYEKLGVSSTAKIVSVVWDVILERYQTMTLGDLRPNLANTISAGLTKSVSALKKSVNAKISSLQTEMDQAIDEATQKITGGAGGYIVIQYNANEQPTEILVMDTPDITTAQNVLRINQAGIGFSTTGASGPFTSAWTIDGSFVANFIRSGTLTANLIRAGEIRDTQGNNFWNLETGDFAFQGMLGDADVASTVVAVDVQYGNSSSSATVPSTWTSDAAWEQGKFLWTRMKYTLRDGTTSYSSARQIAGASGIGVSSVVEQYYLSTSNTTTTGGTWSDTQQTWVDGRYYWTRSKITWSSGSTTYTSAVLAMGLTNGNQSTKALNDSLNQTEVFNRLTNNGALQGLYMDNGNLYINASYIATGMLSDVDQTCIFDLNNGFIGLYNNGRILILGSSAYLKIGESYFTASSIEISSTLAFKNKIGNYYYEFGSVASSQSGNEIRLTLKANTPSTSYSSRLILEGVWIELLTSNNVTISSGITSASVLTYELYVIGDMTVTGTKSRSVETDDHGKELLYALETPTPMFSDIGEGIIGADGLCYVSIDPKFAATIEEDCAYQVFLQSYSEFPVYVSERTKTHFIVHGEPGKAFGWNMTAKQRDFADRRLEDAEIRDGIEKVQAASSRAMKQNVTSYNAESIDYGEEFISYKTEIERERTALK